MRRTRFDNWDCSIARTVDLLGDWWTPMVVRSAFLGARRFEQLQESLGIPRNILAERLKTLVEEGVLEKRAYQDRPVRYEYRLTEKGIALYPVIITMMRWGDEWLDWPEGPPVELLDRETGEPVEPVLVDVRTGAPLDPRQVTVRRRRGEDPGWPRAVPTPRRDPRP